MKKLVWLDGTEVCVVEHAFMVVEEKEHELLVLKTGDDEAYVRQYASRSSLCNGACRTVAVMRCVSDSACTCWIKVGEYRRGVALLKIRRAAA